MTFVFQCELIKSHFSSVTPSKSGGHVTEIFLAAIFTLMGPLIERA